MTCCQLIHGEERVGSPFNRMISFSYYDGTTSGLTQCAVCGREYCYDLLSWDEKQDVRIFGLCSVAGGSFHELTTLCSGHETPRWPEWHPEFKLQSDAAQREAFTRKKDEI